MVLIAVLLFVLHLLCVIFKCVLVVIFW